MRITARILFTFVFCLLLLSFLQFPAFAQTINQPSNTNNFLTPNVDSNVPQNSHEYAQIAVINLLSAFMCQLTGIDPTNPRQACLGIDPTNGKIGVPPTTGSQTFGQVQTQTQVGGAAGLLTDYIGSLYTPAISSRDYFAYLGNDFGIVHPAMAAGNATGCSTSFGYGFCGLTPILALWTAIRDFAYAMLTILFIAIGIGVMLRFKVDPRTVMTLQNQIPRVIVAILLITFSYAIAGIMVDLMWTATYAGINFISGASNSTVDLCNPDVKQPLANVAEQRLLDDPLSFANTIFRGYGPNATQDYCNNPSIIGQSGLLTLSSDVSSTFGDLVQQLIENLLGININSGCGVTNIGGCVGGFFTWITEQIIKLIIVAALLIALFRLWFELIKAYVIFLIFVIMGPLWIVMGLVPGRPLGFEKWLRIVFANLAVFPLVAFLLVFARVIIDSAATPTLVLGAATGAHGAVLAAAAKTTAQNVFYPPLVGNPNIGVFTTLIGFGAVMLTPNVPSIIKEQMKATGPGGKAASAALLGGLGVGAAAATNPAKKAWGYLNRTNQHTGAPEGAVAVMRQRIWQKTPMGRHAVAKRKAMQHIYHNGGDVSDMSERKRLTREFKDAANTGSTRGRPATSPSPSRPTSRSTTAGSGNPSPTGTWGAPPRDPDDVDDLL